MKRVKHDNTLTITVNGGVYRQKSAKKKRRRVNKGVGSVGGGSRAKYRQTYGSPFARPAKGNVRMFG